MVSRRGYQCAQAREELVGGQGDGASAVGKGALHPVLPGAIVELAEAVGAQGGTGAVATEALEALAIIFVDCRGGVQGEALDAGTQGRAFVVEDGSCFGGRPGGGGVGLGEQVARIFIGLQATAAHEQLADPLDDRLEQ
jgi:hypothetical protein